MSKFRIAIPLLLFFGVFVEEMQGSAFSIDANEYQTLYQMGVALTDKASWHNYLEIYSHYFKHLRNEKIKFLEIGIWGGGSLALWENYFKKAEIHGIDTTLAYIKHPLKRTICHIADQSKPADLLRVMKDSGGEFDIILDDGGHLMNQQITSFVTLFPYVKKGGLYIIEDLHTSYWRDYGGSGTQQNPNADGNTTIAFLKSLIDDVNYVGAASGRASHRFEHRGDFHDLRERLDEYKEQILSMHFYDSICFIIKR